MKAKYVNPFTDFGFKKIFGEEASKPMLIDFLTNLLPEINIVSLTFKDKDKLGKTDQDRRAIYDIYCENNAGEKIIIELQKAKQNYFKDRTVYYATFPIQEQADKGNWDYKLNFVYCVGILDFKFEDKIINGHGEVLHTVMLKDQNNQVFYKKLKFIYLEMPHFIKQQNELLTRLDKWLYFIKHLEDFQHIPDIFKDDVFIQAFEKAEIAKYNETERKDYEQSLKIFRDNKATYEYAIDTAFGEGELKGRIEGELKGRIEGEQKGRIDIAKNLKHNGIDYDIISKSTGLSNEEIEKL
jgi:predicted transposase/invertase (TIGR01784 family)